MAKTTYAYAEVIVPKPMANTYTYGIPEPLLGQIEPGMMVVVPFAKKSWYAAVVLSLKEEAPRGFEIKNILEVLDGQAKVPLFQLKFWQWIAQYYMCSLGQVMQAALPASFKLHSETEIQWHGPENAALIDDNGEIQASIWFEDFKQSGSMKLKDLQQFLPTKKLWPSIHQWLEDEWVQLETQLSTGYKPKTEDWIALSINSSNLESAFEQLKRAPKQSGLLLRFLSLSDYGKKSIKKEELLEGEFAASHLKPLLDKKILSKELVQVSRQQVNVDAPLQEEQLSEVQAEALYSIQEGLKEKNVCLLHGYTGSGKTEIYLRMIREVLDSGMNALLMLPEIALTTQMIDRLRAALGERVLVSHSGIGVNERADVWNQMAGQEGNFLLVGTRSALFLPIHHCGLIVVDEEHDGSYKQQDPAPRYHARDAAVYLGFQEKIPVLLGSATPSLESYANAQAGKYALVELKERYGGLSMPNVEFVNLKKARLHKMMRGDFSETLLKAMEAQLAQKKQVILFQNRRGFAPLLECLDCGWTPQCMDCDISLTYHKTIHKLKCHYCGKTEPVPERCSSCGSTEVVDKGLGTQKIEEQLLEFFPQIEVGRMDWDSTRGKTRLPALIESFQNKEIDVLVGTQMLTKGLDFEGVGLVGVLNADQLLNIPDFRAHERCFQLLTQVAGRAGRKGEQGQVLIQTYQPDHEIMEQVGGLNYVGFFKAQMAERKHFYYPPDVKIIQLTLKHRNIQTLNQAAAVLEAPLRSKFGKALLGPEFPPLSRVRGQYQKRFQLKLSKASSSSVKVALKHIVNGFEMQAQFRSVRVSIDVDPY